MSTGDIKNNLRKLQAELKGINFTDSDLDRLSKGIPEAFLAIYNYAFVNYSRPLAEKMNDLNIELNGKSDIRFIEAMYKVLRELFTYKPPLTKEQFFNPGYSEMKVIMCSEIITHVRKFHKASLPKKQKPVKSKNNLATAAGAVGLSVTSKLGPRPSSAPPRSAQRTKQKQEAVDSTPESRVVSEMDRHFLTSSRIRTTSKNKSQASDIESIYDDYPGDSITLPADLSAIQSVPPIQVVVKSHNSPVKKEQLLPPDDVDIDVMPIDIVASTPCRPAAEDIRVKTTEKHEFVGQLNYLLKQMQDLTNKLVSIEDRMSSVEQQLSEIGQFDNKENNGPLDPARLETLLARMTLVENKIAIMEAQREQSNSSDPQPQQSHVLYESSKPDTQLNGSSMGTTKQCDSLLREPLQHTGMENTLAENEDSKLNKSDKKTSSPIAAAEFRSIHMHEGCEASPSPIANFRRKAARAELTSHSLYVTKDASSIGELNLGRMDMDSLSLNNTVHNGSKILDQKQRIANLVMETEKMLNIEGKADPVQ